MTDNRLKLMLGELVCQVDRARAYEAQMKVALAESQRWSEEADRHWAQVAALEATHMRRSAELRLEQGRAIAARAGVHLPEVPPT